VFSGASNVSAVNPTLMFSLNNTTPFSVVALGNSAMKWSESGFLPSVFLSQQANSFALQFDVDPQDWNIQTFNGFLTFGVPSTTNPGAYHIIFNIAYSVAASPFTQIVADSCLIVSTVVDNQQLFAFGWSSGLGTCAVEITANKAPLDYPYTLNHYEENGKIKSSIVKP